MHAEKQVYPYENMVVRLADMTESIGNEKLIIRKQFIQ
jgi:hypothetical protein